MVAGPHSASEKSSNPSSVPTDNTPSYPINNAFSASPQMASASQSRPVSAYTPASYIVNDSFLTSPQLVSTFEDFHKNLEYVSSAPTLVFERLVAQLNVSYNAVLERERLKLQGSRDENKTLQLSNEQLKKELAELKQTISKANCQCLQASGATREEGSSWRTWLIPSPLYTWVGNDRTGPTSSYPTTVPRPDSASSQKKQLKPATESPVINSIQDQPQKKQPKPTTESPVINSIQDQPQKKQPKAKVDSPVIATFHTSQVRSAGNPTANTSRIIGFMKAYSTPPGVVVGLSELDLGCSNNVRVKAYANNIQKDRFRINVDSWMDTKLYCGGCSWLQIDAADLDFQFGEYRTLEDNPHRRPISHNKRYITFSRPYSAPPQVVVCFSMLDMNHDTHWHAKTYATDVTKTGFTIHIETWDGSRLFAGAAAWIACPSDRSDVRSGTVNTTEVRSWRNPKTRTSGRVAFGGLAVEPRVFVAINSLDIDCNRNLRLKVGASSVNASGMNWYIDAWYDTLVYSAGASYIAII